MVAGRVTYLAPGILLLLLLLVALCGPLNAQFPRGILQWKQDLEFRLNHYQRQHQQLQDILRLTRTPRADFRARKVVFKDLIIQDGALRMERPMLEPALRVLADNTHNYRRAKLNELGQIHQRLDTLRRQLEQPGAPYFFKSAPHPADFRVARFQGNLTLARLVQAHSINAFQVRVEHIGSEEVNGVLDRAYWRYPNLRDSNRDPQNRLFFEGRKTFWGLSVFQRELRSTCASCDSLLPLSTNRMMIKSAPQNVTAPVLFHTNHGPYRKLPILIRNLETPQLSNSHLTVGLVNTSPLYSSGLMRSPPDNVLRHESLVHIHARDQLLELPNKVLVFEGNLVVEEAVIRADASRRSVIGVMSDPSVQLDLSHDNHLLTEETRNVTPRAQRIMGTVVLNSEANFLFGLDALIVNDIINFNSFVNERLVRTDRPARIHGPVEFKTLGSLFDSRTYRGGPIPHLLMAQVDRALQVGTVNGMRLPEDIVVTNLVPRRELHVYGARHFATRMIMSNRFTVDKLVNNMSMPAGVIPLHLNDFVDTTGASQLWLVDGVSVNDVTVHSRQFNGLPLNMDASAESMILNMMLTRDPATGVQLIKAPLIIERLILESAGLGSSGTGGGLLNGLRPEDVLELAQRRPDELVDIDGHKVFAAPVEAADCIFTDLNHLSNWPSHLVRIDRPDSVQTVHSRLVFQSTNLTRNQPPPGYSWPPAASPMGALQINRLTMDFLENTQPANYESNFKLSPELYMLYLALARGIGQNVDGRIRVLDLVHMLSPNPLVNGIPLSDVLRLNEPFRFPDRFVMVGRVETLGTLEALNVTSNYPFDAMDLVQFDKFRIPVSGGGSFTRPIRLNNLVLAGSNQAAYLRTHLLNGLPFSDFANSVMSLTRPQVVEAPQLVFSEQVSLEGLVRTGASLNQAHHFRHLTARLQNASSYSFEHGLQCNAVIIKT